jgi:hypothetical protein
MTHCTMHRMWPVTIQKISVCCYNNAISIWDKMTNFCNYINLQQQTFHEPKIYSNFLSYYKSQPGSTSAVTCHFDDCDYLSWKANVESAVMWNTDSVYQYIGMWIVLYNMNEQFSRQQYEIWHKVSEISVLQCSKHKNGISCEVSKFPCVM